MDIVMHKRTLGIIHLVYGVLTAVAFLFIGSFVAIIFPFIADEISREVVGNGNPEELMEFVQIAVQTIFTLLLIFSALPSIIAGIGLLTRKSWSTVLALIAGCVSIFNFPFGTAVGVYSIYVFVASNRHENEPN